MTGARRRTEAAEAKRERRFERQRRAAAARRREAVRRRIRRTAMAVVAIVAVGAALVILFRPDPEVEGVVKPPNRGGGHTTGATYDTATPTSGRHNPSAPSCGLYGQSLPLDLAVHALEHGTVVVWHEPGLDDDLLDAAAGVLREWDSHWILGPNPGIDEPFVATAWNRRMSFDEPDATFREFVDTYRNRGPERVDCPA